MDPSRRARRANGTAKVPAKSLVKSAAFPSDAVHPQRVYSTISSEAAAFNDMRRDLLAVPASKVKANNATAKASPAMVPSRRARRVNATAKVPAKSLVKSAAFPSDAVHPQRVYSTISSEPAAFNDMRRDLLAVPASKVKANTTAKARPAMTTSKPVRKVNGTAQAPVKAQNKPTPPSSKPATPTTSNRP